MQALVLFETEAQQRHFRPFTATRPLSDLRLGLFTQKERCEKFWPQLPCFIEQPDPILQVAFPACPLPENTPVLALNAAWLLQPELLAQVQQLPPRSVLSYQNRILAFRGPLGRARELWQGKQLTINHLALKGEPKLLSRNWDLFRLNGLALEIDFQLQTQGRQSQDLPAGNQLIGPPNRLFIEEGAQVQAAVLNTQNGPIYLGKHAEIMEGCLVRGALGLCEHSVLKMGAKVYGPTTLGPHSKAGGELNNSILMGMSNKAHDGFLGNSVLGYWCNLGADTNNSNLKNNYSPVSVWNEALQTYENTQLQFCGLFMGDHSKSGINTMFNTGSWVGLGCNVFGGEFPDKHLPNFSWGLNAEVKHQIDKMIQTAEQVYSRRQLKLSEAEIQILQQRYEESLKS